MSHKKHYFHYSSVAMVLAMSLVSPKLLAQNQAQPVIETYGVPAGSAPIDVPQDSASATETYEGAAQESKAALESNMAPAPIPVGATPEVAPAKSKEEDDGSLKGVTFDLGLSVYPIGFNNQTVGETTPNEAPRWNLGVKPSLGLSSTLKTSNGTKISISTGYEFMWSEYYQKTQNSRDFNHALSGSLGIDWSPEVSTTLPIGFEYAVKSGTDAEADNAMVIYSSPSLGYKVNQDLSFSLAYDIFYLEGTTSFVSLFDINSGGSIDTAPTDFLSDDSTLDGDPFGNGGNGGDAPKVRSVFATHKIIPGVSYKLNDTTLGFKYHYAVKTFANDDNNEWTGHFFVPSISQKLPTKGKISLSHELRLRKYDFATVGAGVPKRNFRNRTALSITQPITDKMTYEVFYRLQMVGQNKDNYADKPITHWFYTGVTFAL